MIESNFVCLQCFHCASVYATFLQSSFKICVRWVLKTNFAVGRLKQEACLPGMLEREIFIQTHSIWQATRQTFYTKILTVIWVFLPFIQSHSYEVAVLTFLIINLEASLGLFLLCVNLSYSVDLCISSIS